MIKIIDNLLPESYINEIERICYSQKMAWTYCNETIYTSPDKNDLWNKQLAHVLFLDGESKSEHYKFFAPLLFILEEKMDYKIKELMRLKINLVTTIPDSNLLFLPHIDFGDEKPYLSAVFYINHSDGDTIVYENSIPDRSILGDNDHYQEYLENKKRTEEFVIKQRIEYKRNRIAIFDGSYLHEAKWPMYHKDRIVLNIVFR